MAGEGKKEEEAEKKEEIVVKVDMHCEACAKRVAKSLKGFQGVEEVRADYRESIVVVKGKNLADPVKVCDRIQKKSGRNVQLVSPLPKPPPPAAATDQTKAEDPPKKSKDQPKQEDKKDEPPPVTKVVLNVPMHCEACAQFLRKRIRKIKGVESVDTEIEKDQVTVTSILEASALVESVFKKIQKPVSIVKAKEEEKKPKAEEKKEQSKEREDGAEGTSAEFMNRRAYEDSYAYNRYFYTNAYHPPQIFSDENPNACSIM